MCISLFNDIVLKLIRGVCILKDVCMFESTNAVLNHKLDFFSKKRNSTKSVRLTFKTIDKEAAQNKYGYILNNQQSLETEFAHMFKALQSDKNDPGKQVFWLYCYYCASLLETFHKEYSQEEQAKDYANLKSKIRTFYMESKFAISKSKNNPPTPSVKEETFTQTMLERFTAGLTKLAKTPAHTTDAKKAVASTNLVRIYWIFNRLLMTQALTLAADMKLIEKFDAMFGTHINIDRVINALRAPIPVANFLSVGLFLARFAMDFALLIKHTLFPFNKKSSTYTERVKFEVSKRHWRFMNDLAWALLNLLTNFSLIAKVSASVASYLIMSFLTFDVAMLFYKCYLERQSYLVKKSQYEKELKAYENSSKLSDAEKLTHIKIVCKQMTELELDWQVTQATLYFNAAAAALLALGYTGATIAASPILPVVFFYTCLVGVAIYLSSDSYSKYKRSSLVLEQVDLMGESRDLAVKKFEMARNDFFFTIAKYTTVPVVILTTVAVCWPAAVVIAALYLGYEVSHAYSQFEAEKSINQLTLVKQDIATSKQEIATSKQEIATGKQDIAALDEILEETLTVRCTC